MSSVFEAGLEGMLGRSDSVRKFIGHKVKFAIEGVGQVEGIVVGEMKDRILVKGEDAKITRIPKGKICLFTPVDFEPFKYVPFHVLRCSNKETGCPGVQYIQEGAGIKETDFHIFMKPCPCLSEGCSYATKGELRTVDGTFVREMFDSVLFGDYPQKEKKSAGSTRTTGEAEQSEGEGGGVREGEKSDNGGSDESPEQA